MSVQFRLATHGDYDHEAVVRIGRAIQPDDHISPADLRDRDENRHRAGRVSARWVASVSGLIVGSGSFHQNPWLEPTTFYTHVMVHPDHQGRGYGRSLTGRMEGSASERGAQRLLGQGDEREPRTLRFIENAGFREIDRWWRSTLDLTRFDPRSWDPILERLAATGIRIVSVAELRETRRDWKRDLHRLYVDVERDAPTSLEILEVPFADFEARSLGRQLLADGFLLAMDGDDLIGLTEPQPVDDDPTAISQDMTGVRADHRRRGIAVALKAASATWAKEHEYTSIRTFNAQSNAPMLAVNDRLGFEREHAIIEYLKRLYGRHQRNGRPTSSTSGAMPRDSPTLSDADSSSTDPESCARLFDTREGSNGRTVRKEWLFLERGR